LGLEWKKQGLTFHFKLLDSRFEVLRTDRGRGCSLFKVRGSRFGVEDYKGGSCDLRFGVHGFGVRMIGSGVRVQGLGSRV
jgi:hypothetical protein